MDQVNLFDAKSSLSSLVARAVAGEEIIIAKHGKPMVRLVPVSSGVRKPGSARGQVKIAKDFDKVPAGFKDYV
ncbi:MAG: type II toxin-antitoxin system Phd/YefM family antitoxin [Betaproteobacteria bacterium]